MNIVDAIQFLKAQVPNPTEGLPDDIFYYISSTTPLINIDLLIRDEKGRVLLSWRDDEYSGTGWHIPGGIIRHKETIQTRIKKVALKEIGREVRFSSKPIDIKEVIIPDKQKRSHFISLLFECFLDSTFIPENKGLSAGMPGFLKWHDACPDDLLPCHEMYRKYLETE
jgi:colanic acid biosynthesis protein WcaH